MHPSALACSLLADGRRGTAIDAPCGALNLCFNYCMCTETSCDASLLGNEIVWRRGGPEDVYEADLSLDEDGTKIVGTLLVKEDLEQTRPVQLRLKL